MGLNEKIPNQLLNLTFMTTEEILGKGGLTAVLRYAGLDKFIGNYPPPDFEMVYPLSDMTRFFTSTLGLFGERGARPILFRGGKKAFDLILEFFPDLGITPIFFMSFFFCKKCNSIANDKTCPHPQSDHIDFAGKIIREKLVNHQTPPESMMRKEVAEEILKHGNPFVE